MARIDLHSFDKPYVKLKERILWFDGENTCKPEKILQLAKKGFGLKGIHTTEITSDIRQYNRLVSREDQITVKSDLNTLNAEFSIPPEYLEMDIDQYIAKKMIAECRSMPPALKKVRVQRVVHELELIERFNMVDTIRLMVYIIDTMQATNTVWGIGRGSSVSSYILYLIGVHDVDSVLYGLEPEEFFHD